MPGAAAEPRLRSEPPGALGDGGGKRWGVGRNGFLGGDGDWEVLESVRGIEKKVFFICWGNRLRLDLRRDGGSVGKRGFLLFLSFFWAKILLL